MFQELYAKAKNLAFSKYYKKKEPSDVTPVQPPETSGGNLQMRTQTDSRLYSPNGDLAHNMLHLLKHCAYGLDPGVIDQMYSDYMEFKQCTFDDLAAVAKALVLYLYYANDPQVPDVKSALENAGYFELNPAAQLIFQAKLGQVVLCAYFTRTREANDPDVVKLQVDELMKKAEKESTIFNRVLVSRSILSTRGDEDPCCISV